VPLCFGYVSCAPTHSNGWLGEVYIGPTNIAVGWLTADCYSLLRTGPSGGTPDRSCSLGIKI
jgi:hypothetical protein